LPGGVVEYGETYQENAVREMQEEMGIDLSINNNNNNNTLSHLFTFPYQDNRVRVWGDVYECIYRGSIDSLIVQEVEVESITRMSLQELKDRIATHPDDFMPDACHAMKLYFQRMGDLRVNRRLLREFSSLDCYQLHPRPKVIFFDVDDCLYFDGWRSARKFTAKVDEWCTQRGLEKGYAYQLYKKYGTALRGLRAEGWIEDTPEAVDEFLQYVHDVGVEKLLQPDQELREILLRVDPEIPKYAFTASVREHAIRCLEALGIADLFVGIIDCKTCDLETKHSQHSFETAMRVAGVEDPEQCLFFDDNLTNIEAARKIGWRSVLVGRVGRDGKPVSSEHAELELDRIHQVKEVLPELFGPSESM
jgi:putative hydrolase of the HAD superfamily/pyrimidine and pyridine-specific 5'-nucleotidase